MNKHHAGVVLLLLLSCSCGPRSCDPVDYKGADLGKQFYILRASYHDIVLADRDPYGKIAIQDIYEVGTDRSNWICCSSVKTNATNYWIIDIQKRIAVGPMKKSDYLVFVKTNGITEAAKMKAKRVPR